MLTVLTAAVLTATGCASSSGAAMSASVGIRIDPPSAQFEPGAAGAFKATVTGTAVTDVIWSTDCGSITPAGVFTAPQKTGVCRVTATAVAGAVVAQALVSVGGWAATCAAEPLPDTNVVYACDCQPGAAGNCVPGDDAGPGTKAAPIRSWLKVQEKWRSLPAGGTVALCKGGRWDGNQVSDLYQAWRNHSCSAAAPCTLRDYTPSWANGDEGKPTVVATTTGTMQVLFYVVKDWTADGSGAGNSGYRFLNLRLVRPDSLVIDPATGWDTTEKSYAFRFGERTSDMEVCNCDVEGFGIGMHVYSEGGANCNARNKVRGNRFVNNCSDALLFEGVDTDVDGNYFDNNGHHMCGAYPSTYPWGPTTHTVYFPGETCALDNLRFRNNEVHRNAVFEGYVQGSAVKIRDQGADVLVENNLIDMTPPHPTLQGTVAAISVDNNGNTANAGFTRMVIRRNRIPSGPGNKIAVSSAPGLLVEDNVIWTTGAPVDADVGIFISHKGLADVPASSATIRNNTLYYPGTGSALHVYPIRTAHAASAAGHVITGNVVVGGGLGGACIRADDPTKVAFMDNNACAGIENFSATGTAEWPSNNYGLAAWRAARPTFDALSITPAAAGLFVNASDALSADFTPAPGSPLAAAGSTATCTVAGLSNQPCSAPTAPASVLWTPTDNARARGPQPDIGAFQH